MLFRSVILLAFVVLLATGTISFKSNENNSKESSETVNNNAHEVNDDVNANEDSTNVEDSNVNEETVTNNDSSENKTYTITYDNLAGSYVFPNGENNSYITFWNNGTFYLELPSRFDKKVTAGKFGNYIIKDNEILINYLMLLDPCEDYYIENSSRFYGTDTFKVNDKINDGFSITFNGSSTKLQHSNVETFKDFETAFIK